MKVAVTDIANIHFDGGETCFSVKVRGIYPQEFIDLYRAFKEKSKPLIMDLSFRKKRRSMSANAYCWVLCDKIAKKVGTDKETVYKKNISEVGAFELVTVAIEAAKRFIEVWQGQGLGWIAEPIGAPRNGYMDIMAYHGSSTYSTEEMSRLIDAIVTEAKELGIETMPDEELASLVSSWTK